MLNTLLKIGEWQSQGKSEWDRFLEYPKVQTKDKFGNEVKNYVLPIIFDLDKETVIIDSEDLKEYDERDVEELKLLRTLSSRNKKIYSAVKGINIKYIFNTFFGDNLNSKEFESGNLKDSIRKDFPNLLTQKLEEILISISKLRVSFLNQTSKVNEKAGVRKFSLQLVKDNINLSKNEEIVILYVKIKSYEHKIYNSIPFKNLDEYQDFLTAKFFPIIEKKKEVESNKLKLCYASGKLEDNVNVMDLSRRDSLNKMFGYKTYCSYLPNFDKKSGYKSYQISSRNSALLDYASDYFLDQRRTVYIAGIRHCFIPEFLSNEDVDLDLVMTNIGLKADLLFSFKSLQNVTKEIDVWVDKPFWINFLAIEIPIDKKSLKTQSLIKDINSFHLDSVLRAFSNVNKEMYDFQGFNWQMICGKAYFNLYSVYKLIPVRKANINSAYQLLKAIFENKKIEKNKLYKNFTELILCYYFNRFDGYSNQKKPTSDGYFRYSVRDIVFKYHAFFQVLKKLKLINMEQSIDVKVEKTGNKYDDAIQDFFEQMDMHNRKDQQAMFYLGRMLNSVEWIQLQKKIKKTVINLVNFNGLDKNSIERLRNDLVNKAKQHGQVGKVKLLDGKFAENFKYNGWNMDAQEALFFLLTGYSYRVTADEAKEQETIETIETN